MTEEERLRLLRERDSESNEFSDILNVVDPLQENLQTTPTEYQKSKPTIDNIIDMASRDIGTDINVSGRDRTEKRNAQVGGASNSMHLEEGGARDVSVKNLDEDQRQKLKDFMIQKGYRSIDETGATDGTGSHLHFDGKEVDNESTRSMVAVKDASGNTQFRRDPNTINTINDMKGLKRKSPEEIKQLLESYKTNPADLRKYDNKIAPKSEQESRDPASESSEVQESQQKAPKSPEQEL